jgi:hypothetical protein
MPDNVGYTPGTGAKVATREVTYSGETALAQVVGLATFSGADDAKTITDIDESNPLPIKAMGELIEAIEAMRMAIQSLNRTVGMAQVNPLTGRMLVDGAGVTQPVSGTVTATANQSGAWNITNLATIGGQNANSQIPSFERMTADNLRRNISVT